jgi:hypothetical protein
MPPALKLLGLAVALVVVGVAGCRRGQPCDGVPTTADGCRERCHDRGAEMAFFRYEPGEYPCDAVCECEP